MAQLILKTHASITPVMSRCIP